MEFAPEAMDEFDGLGIDDLKSLLREKNAKLLSAQAELLSNTLLLQMMKLQIAQLKRMQFGKHNEKRNQIRSTTKSMSHLS
jgi:hypothetical protein